MQDLPRHISGILTGKEQEARCNGIQPDAVTHQIFRKASMGSTNLQNPKFTPEKVTETAKMVAANATDLATLLKKSPYPG